jgi:hypothetical protein
MHLICTRFFHIQNRRQACKRGDFSQAFYARRKNLILQLSCVFCDKIARQIGNISLYIGASVNGEAGAKNLVLDLYC